MHTRLSLEEVEVLALTRAGDSGEEREVLWACLATLAEELRRRPRARGARPADADEGRDAVAG